MASYISPKVILRNSKNGKGLFALNDIKKNAAIVDYIDAPGKFLTTKEADIFYDEGNDYMIQVDEDLFFVATTEDELEDSDYINHSCDPNCGFNGTLKIVAMRDIQEGEEITIDYAMSESSQYQMKCHCGNVNCRKVISGDDWKNKKLQQKYKDYFSKYLQKRMPV